MSERLRLTSIRQKLMFLFFTITATAILVIYFYVVPQLESSLTSEKLDSLKRDAANYSGPLQEAIGRDVTGRELDSLTRRIAEQADAGVTLLGIPRNELDSESSESPPYVISDSREARRKAEPSNAKVLEAASGRNVTTSTRSEGGQRLAQAAKPLLYQGAPAWVVVFSEPLNDVADNVALIKRQILIAGLIALAVALTAGYYAASALSKRVKRLERGAGEVAAGNFSAPIPIDSEDELGQLARAFNEMQKRLARLDQARKEFIANASHELRTPIFSLGGFVELMQDEDIDEDTRAEFLTTMREQIDRLQKLTTDLLDLSRLDAGSLELELEPVPLRTLAGEVAGEFAAAAAMRGSLIDVVGDGSEPEVEARCDPARVAQILRVLLDNALTHSGDGASVTISAGIEEGVPRGRGTAVLTVTDNGPGVPSADLPHVFDRFHTGNTAQGSGLGLAIARELAERMLGSLDVTSAAGKTAFKLTLPLVGERPAQQGDRAVELPTAASLSGRA
jgi:signal transduction histidine kinase